MEYIFKGVFGIIYFVAMFRLSNCKLLSENGPFFLIIEKVIWSRKFLKVVIQTLYLMHIFEVKFHVTCLSKHCKWYVLIASAQMISDIIYTIF